MRYEYQVFMVHQDKESTFLHLSAEPLRDAAVLELARPGRELDGRSVIISTVLAHPLDGRPEMRDGLRLLGVGERGLVPLGALRSSREAPRPSVRSPGVAQHSRAYAGAQRP
jgi:hypothetical protein